MPYPCASRAGPNGTGNAIIQNRGRNGRWADGLDARETLNDIFNGYGLEIGKCGQFPCLAKLFNTGASSTHHDAIGDKIWENKFF